MSVKVEISKASLSDITEKACEKHKQTLDNLCACDIYDIKCVIECLEDVIKLWEAVDDNFEDDDELILTIERRTEEKDGTD